VCFVDVAACGSTWTVWEWIVITSLTHTSVSCVTLDPLTSAVPSACSLSRKNRSVRVAHWLYIILWIASLYYKCLRFGHWLTLRTLNIHLLTYLLTYLISFHYTSMLNNKLQKISNLATLLIYDAVECTCRVLHLVSTRKLSTVEGSLLLIWTCCLKLYKSGLCHLSYCRHDIISQNMQFI